MALCTTEKQVFAQRRVPVDRHRWIHDEMISAMGPSKRIVWPGVVSLSIPETWTHSEEEGVIRLFDPESGVGVIHVSFAIRSRPGDPSEEEALELLEGFCRTQGRQILREAIQQTCIADSPAAEVAYSDGAGTFWHVWQVIGVRRAVFITYNCDEADAAVETAERLAVVSSLAWDD